jgi:hypothetical protein
MTRALNGVPGDLGRDTVVGIAARGSRVTPPTGDAVDTVAHIGVVTGLPPEISSAPQPKPEQR